MLRTHCSSRYEDNQSQLPSRSSKGRMPIQAPRDLHCLVNDNCCIMLSTSSVTFLLIRCPLHSRSSSFTRLYVGLTIQCSLWCYLLPQTCLLYLSMTQQLAHNRWYSQACSNCFLDPVAITEEIEIVGGSDPSVQHAAMAHSRLPGFEHYESNNQGYL